MSGGALERWKVSRNSGRNAKFPYYAGCVAAGLVPGAVWRWLGQRIRDGRWGGGDPVAAAERAAYACKLAPGAEVGAEPGCHRTGREGWPRRKHTYFFDARSATRWFPRDLAYRLVLGDVTWIPERPSFVKSRPVAGDNANSVLLPLNRVRHFVFVDDPLAWEEKDDVAVFRGKIHLKPKRMRLFEAWFGKPGFDFGDTSGERPRPEWVLPPLSIWEQLRHRFVMSVEGNDVASNLKWIFHSNSLAVMPRPEFETWFEEGRLLPGVHYIEVRPDFADLEEKIRHYAARPALCAEINRAEKAWAARFRDPATERLAAVHTAWRYFRATGQM